ncbi:immunoglobulin-like domain-containing protein [Streptomyces sp. NPDC005385]|uniref:immunoglobulin-like domain-containing protein n=1 Tax=Streptomyces sp. NPDC005385 TaxID=3157039 RepID=UPI0033B7E717
MKHAALSRTSRTVMGGLSVAALGVGLLVGPTPAAAGPAQGAPGTGPTATMVIHPVIDTGVIGTSPQQRTWASTLGVRNAGGIDASDSQASYLQFDVSPATVPGTVISARIVLTATPESTAPTGTRLTSAFVSDDTWNGEQITRYDPIFTLTGATKPPATDIDGSTATLRTDRGAVRYEGDVTSATRAENDGDGRLSLRIWTADPDATAQFHSDDHSIEDNRPALLVTFEPTTHRDRKDAADAAKDLAEAREYLRRLGPVKHDFPLPSTGRHGSRLTWSSLDDQHLDDRGTVTRPTADLPDIDVALDLKVTDGSVTLTDRLRAVVPKDPKAKASATVDAALRPVTVEREVTELISQKWATAFTPVAVPKQVLTREVPVVPGQSIQAAVDSVAAAGGGVVRLKAGLHPLTSPLNMRSTVTLVGAGQDRTVIHYTGTDSAITTTLKQIQDVVMKGFTLEGVKGDLGGALGIYFAGADPESAHHHRIALQDVTVKNFPGHGVHIKRATDLITDHMTSMYNGERGSLFHNSYWLFDKRILQSDSQLSKPVLGKGAKYTSTSDVITQRMEIHHAVGNGIQADGSNDERIFFQKLKISNVGKTALWMICEIFNNPNQYTEDPAYAPNQVIINESSFVDNLRGGVWKIAQDVLVRNSVFDNIQSDLILMKSNPEFENVGFKYVPEYSTENGQVPAL